MQFPGNAAPLLLLGGHELGGERANLGAVSFRQRLETLPLGDVGHECHGELYAGLIDGAEADFDGEP